MSAIIGFFIGGCIWGLIPLAVGMAKNKKALGIGLMILCGVIAIFSSSLPFWVAVISGIVLMFIKTTVQDPLNNLETAAAPLRTVYAGEWACPNCGFVNKDAFSKCMDCKMTKADAEEWHRRHPENQS